jgi:hypothetical protein
MIKWHRSCRDLYPSYSPEEQNEVNEYYFQSEQVAFDTVCRILSRYERVGNSITLWRASDKLYDNVSDNELLGPWTSSRFVAADEARRGAYAYIVSTSFPFSSVDWETTVGAALDYTLPPLSIISIRSADGAVVKGFESIECSGWSKIIKIFNPFKRKNGIHPMI